MENGYWARYEVRQPTAEGRAKYDPVAAFDWEQDARNYVHAINQGLIAYNHPHFPEHDVIAVSLKNGEVVAW